MKRVVVLVTALVLAGIPGFARAGNGDGVFGKATAITSGVPIELDLQSGVREAGGQVHGYFRGHGPVQPTIVVRAECVEAVGNMATVAGTVISADPPGTFEGYKGVAVVLDGGPNGQDAFSIGVFGSIPADLCAPASGAIPAVEGNLVVQDGGL